MKNGWLLMAALSAAALLTACEGFGFGQKSGGPGDGSVKCPGGKACPDVALLPPGDTPGDKGATGTRGWYGIAGDEPGAHTDARPRILICTGDAQADKECPSGYIGRLVLKDALPDMDLQTPTVCRNGAPPCKPKTWAIVCTNGRKGCPMRQAD